MYRTVEFAYGGDIGWSHDLHGDPVTPGGLSVASALCGELATVSDAVSEVELHEDYGWAFRCEHRGAQYELVLNAVDPAVYVTLHQVHGAWRGWRRFLSGDDRADFDEYCTAVTRCLEAIPGVNGIRWQAYTT